MTDEREYTDYLRDLAGFLKSGKPVVLGVMERLTLSPQYGVASTEEGNLTYEGMLPGVAFRDAQDAYIRMIARFI